MGRYSYVEVEGIKEDLCMKFFETCEKLQNEAPKFHNVSYKEIMPAMHIRRNRFQRMLNSISRNLLYFKIEKGYIVSGSNISGAVDWSKRFMLFGKPVYHFKVERYYD